MLGLRVNNHPALQPDRSSLFTAYAISFRHTWKNCRHAVRHLSVNLVKLQRGSQPHSSCVWLVMKRLLILTFIMTQMLQNIIWYNITYKVTKYCNTFAQMYIYSCVLLSLVVDDYCCNHCRWCPLWSQQWMLTYSFDPNDDFKLKVNKSKTSTHTQTSSARKWCSG